MLTLCMITLGLTCSQNGRPEFWSLFSKLFLYLTQWLLHAKCCAHLGAWTGTQAPLWPKRVVISTSLGYWIMLPLIVSLAPYSSTCFMEVHFGLAHCLVVRALSWERWTWTPSDCSGPKMQVPHFQVECPKQQIIRQKEVAPPLAILEKKEARELPIPERIKEVSYV